MTAGTSLSEAAVGRPSLLQAAVCHPSLSKRRLLSLHCQKRAPAPSTGTPAHGTQHQHPPPTGSPPRAQPAPSTDTGTLFTTCTASSQHWPPQARSTLLQHGDSQRPAPAPPVSTARTASSQHQHQHRRLAPSTMSPLYARSRFTAPAPARAPSTQHCQAPATCPHHVHTQLTAPAPAPAT